MGAPTWPPYPRGGSGRPGGAEHPRYRRWPRHGPHTPRRLGRPGGAVALLVTGDGPDLAPLPPSTWGTSATNRGTARLPPRGDCERDALRGHRQLGESHAGRVLDRVGNGGRRRNDRRLANAARTERSGRRRLPHADGLDVRQVGGGELAVVEQARVHEPALVVVHQPLGQRHAEALHGPALHLALDAEGVDGF